MRDNTFLKRLRKKRQNESESKLYDESKREIIKQLYRSKLEKNNLNTALYCVRTNDLDNLESIIKEYDYDLGGIYEVLKECFFYHNKNALSVILENSMTIYCPNIDIIDYILNQEDNDMARLVLEYYDPEYLRSMMSVHVDTIVTALQAGNIKALSLIKEYKLNFAKADLIKVANKKCIDISQLHIILESLYQQYYLTEPIKRNLLIKISFY